MDKYLSPGYIFDHYIMLPMWDIIKNKNLFLLYLKILINNSVLFEAREGFVLYCGL